MTNPTYDAATKTFKPNAEPKEKGHAVTLRIVGETKDKLMKFAQQDGFTLTRKDKNGKQVPDDGKISNVVSTYANQAVLDWIDERESR